VRDGRRRRQRGQRRRTLGELGARVDDPNDGAIPLGQALGGGDQRDDVVGWESDEPTRELFTHVCSSASRGADIASIVANVTENEVVGNVLIGVMLVGVAATGHVERFIVVGGQGQSTRTIESSHGAS
jgi:hypothetical protein